MQTEDLAEPPPTSLTKIMAFKSNIFEVSAEYSGWNAPPHFINYSLSAPSAVVASPLMHNLLIRAASKSLIGEEWCQQMEKTRGIFGFFYGFFYLPVMKKGGSTLNSKAWLNSAIKIDE